MIALKNVGFFLPSPPELTIYAQIVSEAPLIMEHVKEQLLAMTQPRPNFTFLMDISLFLKGKLSCVWVSIASAIGGYHVEFQFLCEIVFFKRIVNFENNSKSEFDSVPSIVQEGSSAHPFCDVNLLHLLVQSSLQLTLGLAIILFSTFCRNISNRLWNFIEFRIYPQSIVLTQRQWCCIALLTLLGSAAAQTTCSTGYYLSSSVCRQCSAGSYSIGGTSTTCTLAPAGLHVTSI